MERDISVVLQKMGEKIKKERMKAGITQEQMEGDGLYVRYIQNIEAGKSNITVRTLHRIAVRIGIPIRKLFDFEAKD